MGATLHMGAKRLTDASSPARMKAAIGEMAEGEAVRSQFFGQSTFSRLSVVNGTSVAARYDGNPEEAAMYAACGCGFQTGAGTVLNVLKPQADDCVVVVGLGGVGLTALMAAKYLGVDRIIAVDIDKERLKFAKELGASHVIDSRATSDLVAEVMDLTQGEGVDFAIDCVGQCICLYVIVTQADIVVGNAKILEDLVKCLTRCG